MRETKRRVGDRDALDGSQFRDGAQVSGDVSPS